MEFEELEKRMMNFEEKICFICEKESAKFCIKGRPQDCYCKECAIDNFGSIDYLEVLK
jgi:hypothetical protein